MARAKTDSTIEYGLIGVGEGSVQNMGTGGGGGGGGGGVRLTSRVGLFVSS